MASTCRQQERGWSIAHPFTVMGAVLLLVLVLWWMLFTQLERDRREILGTAGTNGSNLAQAFEEHVIRTVKGIDGALLALRDDWRSGKEHFRQEVLDLQKSYDADVLLQVAVIGKDGRLRFSNLKGAADGMDLSDREHFRFQRESAEDGLYISRPVLGRVSGRWSIQFARKIKAPDGSFDGVVVASLDPDYFSKFYQSIDVGEGGAITLLGADGIVRARASRIGRNEPVGQAAPSNRPFLLPDAPAAGVLEVVSSVDGVFRLLAYRRLTSYPLVVLVGLSMEEVLAPYASRRKDFILLGGALSLVLLVGGAVLARSLGAQRRYRQFLQEDRTLLAAANDQLTAQQRRLQTINDSLRLLNQIATLHHTSVEDKIAAALGLGRLHLGLEVGIFSRIDGDRYEVVSSCAPSEYGLQDGDTFDLGATCCALAVAAGDVVAIDHMGVSGQARSSPYQTRKPECYIGVPLMVGGQVYGTINFSTGKPCGRTFDEADLEFLRLLGRWAATAITEENNRKELLRLATTDSLTRVWNRRHFLTQADKELARCARYDRPMTVVMLDIDRFKQINDIYGHHAGDEALKMFAAKCSESLRNTDLFGRLGGEEFAAVLVETGGAAAAEVCDRLCKGVAAIEIPLLKESLRFTVSIGFAELSAGENLEDLLGRADEALYHAKSRGRNRAFGASLVPRNGDRQQEGGRAIA